jgi:hypothetical protein
MDINKLLKALDDDSNETLLNFTMEKIREMNLNILNELQLPKKETIELYNKLKNYKYVDDVNDLKYGTFIRWIPIENATQIHLKKGAIFCEFKNVNNGLFCVCKNFGFKLKHFQISMEKNLIFQKLTEQEFILLSALEHLANPHLSQND